MIARNNFNKDLCRKIQKRGKFCTFTLIVTLIALQLMAKVLAADWKIAPSLTVTETYLDNLTLAPSGHEQGDFVTEVDPEISIHANGRQAEFNLQYRMQNLFYAKNSDQNTINHQLSTDANAEVIKDWLFLDWLGSYRQIPISSTGKVGFDNLSITDNRTNVGTYSISPYILKKFGNDLLAELRYTYGQVSYAGSTESLSDSDTSNIFMGLASDPAALQSAGGVINQHRGINTFNRVNNSPTGVPSNPLQWSITLRSDETNAQSQPNTDTQSQPNTKIQKAALDLRYHTSPKTAVLASVGYENNEYGQSGTTTTQQGPFWKAGIAWNPTRRTSLEAMAGESMFGNTYNLIFRHQARATTAEVLYVEDFTTTAETVLANQLLPGVDQLGNLILDPTTGKPQLVNVPLPTISTEVYLRKRLTANLSRTIARSIFNIGAYHEERDFQISGKQERVYGGTTSWNWPFTARTSMLLFGEWQHQNLTESQQEEDNLWQIGLRTTHRIYPDTDGYLEYRYGHQQSTTAENNYEQNSIAASIRVKF